MARNTRQQQETPQEVQETPQETPQEFSMEPGQHNPAVHALLVQAKSLDEEKEALYKRISANRDILRNYQTTGLLSDEQSAAITEFYPVRQKKAGDNGSGDVAEQTAETPAAS